jgi:hypothetical protein
LAPKVLYLFLYAFISFMLARNVILCIFIFKAPTCVLAVQITCFWSVRSVGTSLAFYKAFC